MSEHNDQRQPPTAHYRYLTLDELDRYAKRAEHFMNRGLEQRRWEVVQRHRGEMLAVDAERDRRRDLRNDPSRPVVIEQIW
jgi:hypothetical protein